MSDKKSVAIAIGVSGSFGKINDLTPVLKNLVLKNYEIRLFGTDTIKDNPLVVKELEDVVGHKFIYSISETEPFGPSKFFDIMLIAPMSGTTLSKLANAISDNAVLMTAKSTLRNSRPVVLAVSSNDALGMNGSNLMKLLVMKNIYFVPFGQDNPEEKPNSLVADFTKIEDTIKYAINGKQIQPIIIVKNKRVDET
ncbi:MAG: dpaB [Haloplasmataceae bacterium]|nr:dpaB [Haloplasmataceae bacterium]